MTTILVSSLALAPKIARERGVSRMVSLLDPQSQFPRGHGVADHLELAMHDINEAYDGWNAPAETQVARLIDFVGGWERDKGPILIHCYAGISRSTASAFVTACVHNPKLDETEIAWALRRASPTAWPNTRIVAFADAALGRAGRMTSAIETIGPGKSWEEIGEAEPFELKL